MNIADQLVHTTVRIECKDTDGNPSSGTGFFFRFFDNDKKFMPAIVTNKHVICSADTVYLHLNIASKDGSPSYGDHVKFEIHDFNKHCIFHPEYKVDLAIFPAAILFQRIREHYGCEVFFKGINRELIPSAEKIAELSAVESILMIGYPNNLWDSNNNLPIVRNGITATPPYIDFNGLSDFVIDCACFPGSSGSPVYLYNIGSYERKEGGIELGSRILFLGILWGGPQHTAEGQIQVLPVPTEMKPMAFSRIPNNLGYCVKAKKLLDFEPLLSAQISVSQPSEAIENGK